MSDRGLASSGRGLKVESRALTHGADIPSSGDLYAEYDILKESGFSDGDQIALSDQSGNGRDTAVEGSPTYSTGGTIDPGADTDGTDDGWQVSSANWGTLSNPFTVYLAADFSNISGDSTAFWDGSSNFTRIFWDGGTSNWQVDANGNTALTGGSTSNKILSVRFDDSSNAVFRADGSQQDTGTLDKDMSQLDLAWRDGQSRYLNGLWACAFFYDAAHSTSTMEDVESYINDRFSLGLTL